VQTLRLDHGGAIVLSSSMQSSRTPSNRLQRQRGLSLVEMMVGIAVGLFVVAAASLMVSMQLNDNRRLLLETQVQQDLRASLDIVTRELRRAGFWSRAETGVWSPDSGPPQRNVYLTATPSSGNAAAVGYNYRRPDGGGGPFGFDLTGGAVRTLLAGAGWQELTDKNVLNIESLRIDADNSVLVRLQCPKACPPPGPGQAVDFCWPTIGVRSFIVTITGSAVSDASVRRTAQSRVRLRNDAVVFNAGDVLDPQACPT